MNGTSNFSMYMTSNKVGGFVSTINFLWIINVTKRSSLLIFDVLFSMLVNVGCTIHWTFLWNAFDVLYIENSTYCIFSDRCIRPFYFCTFFENSFFRPAMYNQSSCCWRESPLDVAASLAKLIFMFKRGFINLLGGSPCPGFSLMRFNWKDIIF